MNQLIAAVNKQKLFILTNEARLPKKLIFASIILILASIWSWTIIVEKLVRMKRLKKIETEFDEIFWSGNSFEDLFETFNYNRNDPKSKIFCAAIEEWKKSNKAKNINSSNIS